MKKMSKTHTFLLELLSASLAVGATVILMMFGVPGFLALPICAVIAWYCMGIFLARHKARYQEKNKGVKEYGTNGNWK